MNPEDKNFKKAFWALYVVVFILLYSMFLFSCETPQKSRQNKPEPELPKCTQVADGGWHFVYRCVFTSEVCYTHGDTISCVKRSTK